MIGAFPLLGFWLLSHCGTPAAALFPRPASAIVVDAGTSPSPSSAPWPYAQAHFPVSTKVPAAQFIFDRALTLLYAYNPEEARVLFQGIAQFDPTLAMAKWGVAMSYGMDINTPFDPASQEAGQNAIQQALALAKNATPLEHALIEATIPRYNFTKIEDADRSAYAYRDAMRSLAKRFPNDVNILVLTASAEMDATSNEKMWGYGGKELPDATEILALLRHALALDPKNIAAQHFFIHVMQLSPHPELALDAANALAAQNFEPAAEHLTHMPAHIFTLVGEYHRAAEADRAAIEQFKAYLDAPHAEGHQRYYTHDLLSEAYAYMKSGEFARALSAAQEFSLKKEHNTHLVDTIYAYFNHCERVTSTYSFAGGFCAARAKNAPLVEKITQKLRVGAEPTSTIAADIIEAQLAERQKKKQKALDLLGHAVRFEDLLFASEPPLWGIPVRELLGGLYYRQGMYWSAERTFREDLIRNPRNPRSLFGLAKTLEREGKTQEALNTQNAFKAAWSYADTTLDMSEY